MWTSMENRLSAKKQSLAVQVAAAAVVLVVVVVVAAVQVVALGVDPRAGGAAVPSKATGTKAEAGTRTTTSRVGAVSRAGTRVAIPMAGRVKVVVSRATVVMATTSKVKVDMQASKVRLTPAKQVATMVDMVVATETVNKAAMERNKVDTELNREAMEANRVVTEARLTGEVLPAPRPLVGVTSSDRHPATQGAAVQAEEAAHRTSTLTADKLPLHCHCGGNVYSVDAVEEETFCDAALFCSVVFFVFLRVDFN